MEENKIKRVTAKSPFAGKKETGLRKTQRNLFIFIVFILMSLPLFTTFNEILTRLAEKTGTYTFLSKNIVPFETRAISVILKPLGIESSPTSTHLYISSGEKNIAIFLSWNCLGWQSAILLILTLITGLSGGYLLSSKVETILLGISGTFLINIIRISAVALVAYYFGQVPALIVHDYGGMFITILWFFFFWWFSYSYILEPKESKDAEGQSIDYN